MVVTAIAAVRFLSLLLWFRAWTNIASSDHAMITGQCHAQSSTQSLTISGGALHDIMVVQKCHSQVERESRSCTSHVAHHPRANTFCRTLHNSCEPMSYFKARIVAVCDTDTQWYSSSVVLSVMLISFEVRQHNA